MINYMSIKNQNKLSAFIKQYENKQISKEKCPDGDNPKYNIFRRIS